MESHKDVVVLASGLDTDLAVALTGYLSTVHSFARERHVRVDTVVGAFYVVMDPLVDVDSEALAYGFIRASVEAYLAGWRSCREKQGS